MIGVWFDALPFMARVNLSLIVAVGLPGGVALVLAALVMLRSNALVGSP